MINPSDAYINYDLIIKEYLNPYDTISKNEMNYMKEHLCWHSPTKEGFNCKHFKIINNKLYVCGNERYQDWESRIESFKYMILETLKDYSIQDCEFIMYDDDGINDRTYSKCLYNGKQLPLIVTTSVLDKYNMILMPDFTFSFIPEYAIKNNEEMCREVVDLQKHIPFNDKKSQMVWRGCGMPGGYRSGYFKNNEIYNIQDSRNPTKYRGQCGTFINNQNVLTRKDKSMYKYQLYLNGHQGNADDGAYSSSFKWALMGKSVVFYSAPAFYREFWTHPLIFREKEHYIYTKTPEELDQKYKYYREHEDEAEKIAIASYEFFKQYLLDYKMIKYYVQKLFNEYAKKLDYKVSLDETDKLITQIKHCDYLVK
jgi:hypothetical protein